jgi:hypothetical protein
VTVRDRLQRRLPRLSTPPRRDVDRASDGRTDDDKIARLRRMIDETMQRQLQRRRPAETPLTAAVHGLPGAWLEASERSDGAARDAAPRVRAVRTEHDVEHHHGRIPVRTAWTMDGDAMRKLALLDHSLDPTRLVFLDTETTGLSRGAGTIPFLLGLGGFEDGRLVVEQLFLDELGDEAPMLDRLAERLAPPDAVLVSYNGRAYDEPILRSRAVLHRIGLPERPHVDLLHCARRVYGQRMERLRLIDVEAEVLGFRREADIDGAEIPEAYWAYLRHRIPDAILRVLDHNRHDLVALAALMGQMAHQFARLDRRCEPEDQLGRARVAERVKDDARALQFATEAARGGGPPHCPWRACMLAGRSAGRLRRWDEAEQWWIEALTSARGELELASVHLALAKLYEHRLRRPAEALRHARLSSPAESPLDSERRVRRLQVKLPDDGAEAPQHSDRTSVGGPSAARTRVHSAHSPSKVVAAAATHTIG